LFHSVAEFFSIIIAVSLFVIVWNSRHLSYNKAFVFIGIAYLFVGSIDLIHTLSYKGMGVIGQEWGANPATQLWIAARFMESISLCIFPFLFLRPVNYSKVFAVYFGATAVIFLTIFYWRIFPDCFIDGTGLTPFKKTSEYIICLIFLMAWLLLHQKRNQLSSKVYKLLVFSIVLAVLEELAFTYYISVYDLSNLVGHYLKITSYFLLYLALVRTSLKKPYETLYREIDESEKKFKSLFEEMSSGVALHEIILNKVGKPIDYRFLDINSAFDELTGLTGKDLIGKTVLQVLPNTEEYWIDTYGQVALTGKSVKLDHFSKELNKHFEVNVYCPQYKQFVTVFNDITKQKTSEIEKDELISKLQKAANEINTLRGILPICSYCKQIRDDKGYWNQLETYIGERSDVDFSHSICPTCAQKHYPEMELYDD
jgi:PAS domain S-box-containing protein